MNNNTNENCNIIEENIENDCILSICWDSGYLSAVYYEIDTMELFVMEKIFDMRPDFQKLHNLFRQINSNYIIMSGHEDFIRKVLELKCIEQNIYLKQNRHKVQNINDNVMIYPYEDKLLSEHHSRILKMSFPGMPIDMTNSERICFIESVLPLNQNLVVYCLGNLLLYLDKSWKQLYLRDDDNPVITDLNVFQMDDQLLMDDVTFYGLRILSPTVHLSTSRPTCHVLNGGGISIYNILNKCFSKIGSYQMKAILQQPSRDLQELNHRQHTIAWCMDKENLKIIKRLKQFIKKITNISILFSKIVRHPHKIQLWCTLKKSIYNTYLICKLFSDLNIDDGSLCFGYKLGQFIENGSTLRVLLYTLNEIVDLKDGLAENKFIVKAKFDRNLDSKKAKLAQVQAELFERMTLEMPQSVTKLKTVFMPEFGFIFEIPLWNCTENENIVENENFKFVFRTDIASYYKTSFCEEMNKTHGHLYPDIMDHENRICIRLLQYIKSNLQDIQLVTKLCAKLDCMMAMAEVAVQRNYVKPELTTEKVIEIEQGHHILLENAKANDTNINVVNKNLITILSAPNATGKSVYLKQIAIIVYLAHIGSFIPAKRARIGILDSIFTRIYNPEAIIDGNSTFMVDLMQMGKLMTNSSSNSLVLIDEFGKGTNYIEGKVILASCLESFNNRMELSPITLISTHYGDIYDILRDKNWIVLRTIKIQRKEDGVIESLYEIIDGRNEEKYAMDMAGSKDFFDTIISGNNNNKKSVNTDVITDAASTKKICEIKIKLAYDVLKSYLNNGENFDVQTPKDDFDNLGLNIT